jgi:pimeloyl-ACP methyl ester carboxylesterase
MTPRAVAAAAAAATLLAVAPGSTTLRQELRTTQSEYYAHLVALAPIAGRYSVTDYLQRLVDDGDLLDSPDVPNGFSTDEWHAYVTEIATLDLSLARQLLSQHYVPMESIRGYGETFVRSSRDGTMQPVAVYVPPSYAPSRPAPLVVFLHGHPQPETQLIAPGYMSKLAVVAPYGRGYSDLRGAIDDVYDAVDAASKAFAIDGRKRFLAGYSMGGFSVFEVAPVHPDTWSAIMCISGALLGHDAHEVTAMLTRTPFYVLTGSDDDSIPTKYPTATAVYLLTSGLPVSFYSQPHGTHRIVTLLPILTQAWDDMHRGIVRSPPPVLGGMDLPASAPSTMSLKP